MITNLRMELFEALITAHLEMPAWQLKMTGQEAVVSFSMVTIWSKLASTGAFSWLVGILADQSEVRIAVVT